MRALSTLTQLPTTKSQIQTYVEAVKNDIIGGYIPAEESAIILKSFEDIIKALRGDKDIKEYLQDECEKYNEKTINYRNAQITKSSKATYDFNNCQDSVWNDLKNEEAQIKAALKGRETWLKTIKEPTPDTKTGEIINPPGVSKSDYLTIKLSK